MMSSAPASMSFWHSVGASRLISERKTVGVSVASLKDPGASPASTLQLIESKKIISADENKPLIFIWSPLHFHVTQGD